MAKLSEYNIESIDAIEYGYPHFWALTGMEGLLAFPIVETSATNSYIEIKSYEKSFWGRIKLKGYVLLTFIDDYKIDVKMDDESDFYPGIDTAIGFEFKCDYASYTSGDNFYAFIGGDRKIVLSYHYLIQAINTTLDYHKDASVSTPVDYGINDLTSMSKHLSHVIFVGKIQTMLESLKISNIINEPKSIREF